MIKMLITFLITIFISSVGFTVYKIVSLMMKKASEESSKILNEYKTDEERKIALKNLQKKNSRKALLLYLIMMISIAVVGFIFMLLLRQLMIL